MTIGPPKINPWAAAFTNGLGGLSDMFAKLAMKKQSDQDRMRQEYERDRTYQLALQGQLNQEDQFDRTFAQNNANTEWQHGFQQKGFDAGRTDVANAAAVDAYKMNPTLSDITAQRAGGLGYDVNNPSVGNATPNGMNLLPGMTQATPGLSLGERGAYTRPSTLPERSTEQGMGIAKSDSESRNAAAARLAAEDARVQAARGNVANFRTPGPNAVSYSDLDVLGWKPEDMMTPEQKRAQYAGNVDDFVGWDANGDLQFRRVPDVVGTIIHKVPTATMTGGQAASLAKVKEAADQIDSVMEIGNRTKWKGLGPMEAWVDETLLKYGGESAAGKGATERESLRAQMANLRVITGHEMFGSAFTANEKAQLDHIIADANQHPDMAKVRLAEAKRLISIKLGALQESIVQRSPRHGVGEGPGGVGGLDFDQLLKDAALTLAPEVKK